MRVPKVDFVKTCEHLSCQIALHVPLVISLPFALHEISQGCRRQGSVARHLWRKCKKSENNPRVEVACRPEELTIVRTGRMRATGRTQVGSEGAKMSIGSVVVSTHTPVGHERSEEDV